MKQVTNIIFRMALLIIASCSQVQLPKNIMIKFDAFKAKEKFDKDDKLFYTGIGDLALKPILTEKINLAANDFEKLTKDGITTDEAYQQAIKKGLDRFTELYIQLETEDKERICAYFEELMDIVGLESSGGNLNEFMYGFDPTQKQ